ncbi:hypothetical protein CALCODRAFT_481626 [Calocera cornea HHB12733]|uniref:A-kinase anchor protein 7-like phosphoesterase domain-containing protein n=1 Tax=Calocera cornea HHB12733 TaxID=1353952 RepID=A0A165HJU8_9BASI|nr:hypothetical protein CALCODRAFT_481626 [Calocera cornea HHB12733]
MAKFTTSAGSSSVVSDEGDKLKYQHWKQKGNINSTEGSEQAAEGGGKGKGGHWKEGGGGRARPTHFLALPLSTYPDLHAHIAHLTSAFLASQPPIEGLDPSIVIQGVRMHLTLGVMSLRSQGKGKGRRDNNEDGDAEEVEAEGTDKRLKTPSEALAHLQSLRGQISQFLEGHNLQVSLGGVEVMKSRRRRMRLPQAGGAAVGGETRDMGEDADKDADENENAAERSSSVRAPTKQEDEFEEMADVLYVSIPESNPENARVWALGRMIEQSFKDAGYITETRPLKLHLTIINTSHRRPKPRGRKTFQFSYTGMKSIMASVPPPPLPHGVRASSASATFGPNRPTAADFKQVQADVAKSAVGQSLWTDFGTWTIPAVELWVMGSRDAEGRYVSLGGVPLLSPLFPEKAPA